VGGAAKPLSSIGMRGIAPEKFGILCQNMGIFACDFQFTALVNLYYIHAPKSGRLSPVRKIGDRSIYPRLQRLCPSLDDIAVRYLLYKSYEVRLEKTYPDEICSFLEMTILYVCAETTID